MSATMKEQQHGAWNGEQESSKWGGRAGQKNAMAPTARSLLSKVRKVDENGTVTCPPSSIAFSKTNLDRRCIQLTS
jgi:hypothetical protein